MLFANQEKFCLKDCSIVPCVISEIESRSQVNPRLPDGYFPIFASPMSTVTNENNFHIWEANGIYSILPRTVKFSTRLEYLKTGRWVAVSEKEFKELFVNGKFYETDNNTNEIRICIDTANAHRKTLYDLINYAKTHTPDNVNLIIMVGNIANPMTYQWICENALVDYVRVGIGTGKGCITSTQTGVHYPIASLINECRLIANDGNKIEKLFNFWQSDKTPNTKVSTPKIICDGGIRSISDIIISLALGADYVMLGSFLAATEESAAKLIKEKSQKEYFGMSTKRAQIMINNASMYPIENFIPKTSEGTVKYLDLTGSITGIMNNFESYLRSAMTYTDCMDLAQFCSGNVSIVRKSKQTTDSINI